MDWELSLRQKAGSHCRWNKISICAGGMQGSVLGPSLFLWNINDLPVELTSPRWFFIDAVNQINQCFIFCLFTWRWYKTRYPGWICRICHKAVTDPHDQQDLQQDLDSLAAYLPQQTGHSPPQCTADRAQPTTVHSRQGTAHHSRVELTIAHRAQPTIAG